MNSYPTSSFGDLLRLFRQRKKLSQQLLANKIEVHRNSISLWERDMERPETFSTLLHVATALDLDEEEKRALIEARFGTISFLSFSHLPSKRNPYFTGREHFLHDLHQQLTSRESLGVTQAIVGLGGIGKTQIAMEYAYRYQDSYHTIFWITAETSETIIHSFAEAARHLWLPERNDQDEQRMVMAVKRWLSSHTRWLLILDNLEDLGLVKQFIPALTQGAILITSRRHVTEPVAQAIPVAPLSEEEGALFLLKRSRRILTQESPLFSSEYHQAVAIAHVLDGLPLALDQAGAYILETGSSLSGYLLLCKQEQPFLLTQRGTVPTEHPESVTTTFALAFERIQQINPVAGELLTMCAFLSPDAIPEELFTVHASQHEASRLSSVANPLLFNAALKDLLVYSLIGRTHEHKTLTIHRLVQVVLKERLDKQEHVQWAERMVSYVNHAFPDVTKLTTWAQCQRYLLQALACIELIHHYHIISVDAGRLLHQVGIYEREHARYVQAECHLLQAQQMRIQIYSGEHPDVAQTLEGLAELYYTQGRFSQAEPLLQQALTMRMNIHGSEDPGIASVLNMLGLLAYEQGKYPQAELLYYQALTLSEQTVGMQHSEVAIQSNNLALLYRHWGKYTQARLLFERALVLHWKTLGKDHAYTAQCIDNLGILYGIQGNYAHAELLFQQALEIRKKALGLEHPEIAISYHNLAKIALYQNEYAQAESLFLQALVIHEMNLGKEHPQVAIMIDNLSVLYSQWGKHEQAKQFCQRALIIREKVLSAEHPHIALSLHHLAKIYADHGQYSQAEPLYQRALQIGEQVWGSKHPEISMLLTEMAELLNKQGKYEEAKAFDQRALTLRQQLQAPQPPETTETLHDMLRFDVIQQHTREALSMYQQTLTMCEREPRADQSKMKERQMDYIQLLYVLEGANNAEQPTLSPAVKIQKPRVLNQEAERFFPCVREE